MKHRWRSDVARVLVTIVALCFAGTFASDRLRAEPLERFYGPVEPRAYLLGQFSPEKHPGFVSLSESGIPTRGRTIFLRREVIAPLQSMHASILKELPGTEFWVVSGTRNFVSQRWIWEAKWTGERLVGGKRLNVSVPDPMARARKILEYSSMPGTSRHHWGTDFDINVLTNTYYRSGKGLALYEWLRKNASRFGFCQPYTAGRTAGYLEERWHWSYVPLARPLLRDWEKQIGDSYPQRVSFRGDVASSLGPTYAGAIDASCR